MKRRDLLKGIFAFASMAALPASAIIVQTDSKQDRVIEKIKNDQQSCLHSDVMYVCHKQIMCLRCEKRWNTRLDYCAEVITPWQPDTAYNRGDLVLWHDGSIKKCSLAGISGVASPLRLSTECWQDL